MGKILLIEDDPQLNEGLNYALHKEGYDVQSYGSVEEASANIDASISLGLLDISLPGIDGLTFGRRLSTFHQIPIIYITARDDESDILSGYKIGCEDYITKPFSLPILLEKINVVIRRTRHNNDRDLYYNKDLKFSFTSHILTKSGEEVNLTARELKLLTTFIANKNQILTKKQLLDLVWNNDWSPVDENTLSVTIRRLQSKIEEDPKNPQIIKTVFGIGYKWSDLI